MLQKIFKKIFSYKTYLFFSIVLFSLSGCGFPIRGFFGQMNAPDDDPFRIFASIVIYTILLAVLATIPLYIKKSFKNPRVYRKYRLFWWIASLIFANLSLLIFNIEPIQYKEGYWVSMLLLVAVILLPTLIPATYQHYKKDKT